jgi:hypothetical protein
LGLEVLVRWGMPFGDVLLIVAGVVVLLLAFGAFNWIGVVGVIIVLVAYGTTSDDV